MDKQEILSNEIKKLMQAIDELGNINVITLNSLETRKKVQGKLNKSFGLVVDVKMDLEKLIKKNLKKTIDKIFFIIYNKYIITNEGRKGYGRNVKNDEKYFVGKGERIK